MGPILPADPEHYNLDTIRTLIANGVQIALSVAGGIAVIYIIVGAYYYLTAYGDEEKVNTGKKTITWAIIGIVVIVSGKLIITGLWRFISGSAPNFWF